MTSYSDASGTAVVNEVQNAYNSFAQLVAQYQEHDGSVNTGTTPKVQYGYADGSANTVRKTSLTYPGGQVLEYLYDDEAADKLSRVRTLEWDAAEVCRYSYLGLATFVTTDYLQPQVKLDYALGSGANPYTGFDRFGRIIDLLWENYGASEELVHLKYGYDQASNRTHREDLVAQSYDKDFDELYEYDSLHRLKKFHRGRLTADNRAITSPTLQQSWELDATGNWENFTQHDQADASQTLDQQRVANRVNEIAAITRTVGAQWVTPAYDRNGNMTLMPQPKEPTLPYRASWDAWNRMVTLEEPQGEESWQLVQVNAYDGLMRRIVASHDDTARAMLYSAEWQLLREEHSGASDNTFEFTWGLKYIDHLILTAGDSTTYALHDSHWNVVAMGSSSTDARWAYTAYGSFDSLTATYSSHEGPTPTFGLAGSRLDPMTLLYEMRHRFLSPRLGSFLSNDPTRENAATELADLGAGAVAKISNFFRYADSNPITYTDPYGLEKCDCQAGQITLKEVHRACGSVTKATIAKHHSKLVAILKSRLRAFKPPLPLTAAEIIAGLPLMIARFAVFGENGPSMTGLECTSAGNIVVHVETSQFRERRTVPDPSKPVVIHNCPVKPGVFQDFEVASSWCELYDTWKAMLLGCEEVVKLESE